MRTRSVALAVAFAWAALSAGHSLAGDAGGPLAARSSPRAEELLPKSAMGLVAVRNISRTLERVRGLGLWRVAESLELPAQAERALKTLREQLGAALAVAGVTVEDVERLFKGGAFAALLDLAGDPPSSPRALVWIEARRPEARAIESFTAFLAGLAGAQGLAVESYDYLGTKVSTVGLPLPGMPLELAWAFAAEGFAFSVGREPLEELVSRAAARDEKPKRESLADIPACAELRKRLGEDEDLLVLWNVPAMLARLGAAVGPRERQVLAATGLDRSTAAYGLRVRPRRELSPGGVKEALVLVSPEKKGTLSLLALPELPPPDPALAAELDRSLLAAEVSIDAERAFAGLRELARIAGGEQAAEELSRVIADAAAAAGVEPGEFLRALSGRLSVRASPREAGPVPDATLVLDSRNPEVLAKLVGTLARKIEGVEVRRLEFRGAGITALLPEDRDVPAALTPAFAMEGDALAGALSVQGLKRFLRERARAGLAAELDVDEAVPRMEGATCSALGELSGGRSAFVALDLARAGGVAFDIATFVPGRFGRRFRELTLRMPPVEDLLGELGGVAVALYGREGVAAIEAWSPTGFAPLVTGVAIAAERLQRGRPAVPPRPPGRVPPREEDLF